MLDLFEESLCNKLTFCKLRAFNVNSIRYTHQNFLLYNTQISRFSPTKTLVMSLFVIRLNIDEQ